jgi:hypothetical protein
MVLGNIWIFLQVMHFAARGVLDTGGLAVDMSTGNPRLPYKDFSELYRAAFAEQDPERKGVLLREVQKVIDNREQSYQVLPPAAA